MTGADFPRVHLPGGPYGFPPMTAESRVFDTARDAMDDVVAAQRTMVEDLRTQATALGLDLNDFELTIQRLEPNDADFTAGRIRFRAEATLRRSPR